MDSINKDIFFNSKRVKDTINVYMEKYSNYTPCIIYNTQYINEVINYLKRTIPKHMKYKLLYAMKANSNTEILEKLNHLIDGVDVASIDELNKAKIYFSNDNISINGPAFRVEEVNKFLRLGYNVDINSIDYLTKIKKSQEIGIRICEVNDYFDRTSKFGINIFDKNIENDLINQNIKRIHLHFGIKDDNFIKKLEKILIKLKSINLLKNINQINIGGGFHNLFIEKKMSIFFNHLYRLFCKFNIQDKVIVIIEPGYLVVNYSGFLFSSVISSFIENNIQNVTLDFSIFKSCIWFNPKILTILNKNNQNNNIFKTNIFGNTCFEGDKYYYDFTYKKLSFGDKIIFYPVGAYVKSNHSNLHEDRFMKEIYI